jgi:hypothetical protein
MNALESDARVRELTRCLNETTDSISWRITAPLRWLHRVRPRPPVQLTRRSLTTAVTTDESTLSSRPSIESTTSRW